MCYLHRHQWQRMGTIFVDNVYISQVKCITVFQSGSFEGVDVAESSYQSITTVFGKKVQCFSELLSKSTQINTLCPVGFLQHQQSSAEDAPDHQQESRAGSHGALQELSLHQQGVEVPRHEVRLLRNTKKTQRRLLSESTHTLASCI